MNEYSDIIAETQAQDGTRLYVELIPDTGAEDPRGWISRAGVIHVVDLPRTRVPRESDVPGLDDVITDHDFRAVARWLRMVHGATVVLPLYSVGGDGAIAAGTADEMPTAGNYDGVTFDTPATRAECFTPTTSTTIVAAALAADVATYAQWAEGDVWGYLVARQDTGEEMDSCWGFIGREWAEQAAREAMDTAVADLDDQAAAAAQQAADEAAELDDLRLVELGGWRF